VNCTEIDLKKNGIMGEFFDLGNVTITFDRPTHQEEFILEDLTDCERVGNFLTRELMNRTDTSIGINYWTKSVQKAVVN
jgi:hypothetical protein